MNLALVLTQKLVQSRFAECKSISGGIRYFARLMRHFHHDLGLSAAA